MLAKEVEISQEKMRCHLLTSLRWNCLMFGVLTSWNLSHHIFSSQYILIAVDYVSKWVKAIALPTNDTRVIMKFLKKNFFTSFETPRAIISNAGKHFCNRQFKTLLSKYGIKHCVATYITHKLAAKWRFSIENWRGFQRKWWMLQGKIGH